MLPESVPDSDADLVDLAFFLGQKTKQTCWSGKTQINNFFFRKSPVLEANIKPSLKGVSGGSWKRFAEDSNIRTRQQ